MSDAPPSYETATGSSATSTKPKPSSHLAVPDSSNGIPASNRRSMEDEHRSLPAGWVRQFDAKENHQFFVDTRANPPHSIWHHPYDDDQYLSTLSTEERERIQEEESHRKLHVPTSPRVSTDDESHASTSKPHHIDATLPPRPTGDQTGEKKTFGRKLKDKVTGSTHEERVRERAQRDKEEREYYEAHMKFRAALVRAEQTGEPQFFAKDRDGKDVYIEPPTGLGGGMGGGFGGGRGYGGYGARGYGYNPYTQGPYADPNVRFIRPQAAYNRPYGGGYGGGIGLPIMGGLMGGALLGGLLF